MIYLLVGGVKLFMIILESGRNCVIGMILCFKFEDFFLKWIFINGFCF